MIAPLGEALFDPLLPLLEDKTPGGWLSFIIKKGQTHRRGLSERIRSEWESDLSRSLPSSKSHAEALRAVSLRGDAEDHVPWLKLISAKVPLFIAQLCAEIKRSWVGNLCPNDRRSGLLVDHLPSEEAASWWGRRGGLLDHPLSDHRPRIKVIGERTTPEPWWGRWDPGRGRVAEADLVGELCGDTSGEESPNPKLERVGDRLEGDRPGTTAKTVLLDLKWGPDEIAHKGTHKLRRRFDTSAQVKPIIASALIGPFLGDRWLTGERIKERL